MVSAELCLSFNSEKPEAVGDADSASLGNPLAESGGVPALAASASAAAASSSFGTLFMATNTLAASRSWTCWCLEISNFDVYDHSGVCSHLQGYNGQRRWSKGIRDRARIPFDWRTPPRALRRRTRGYGRRGHEQVFGQATAVLVALPTLLAAKLNPAALPAFLCKRLAVACPPDTTLLLSSDCSVLG